MTCKFFLGVQRQAFDNLTTGISKSKAGKLFCILHSKDQPYNVTGNNQCKALRRKGWHRTLEAVGGK
ncbi:hypothetical protein Rhopal_007152-T1 [Rhodotorula paludigena]|uniref:Uncharacterized protein n=1 Tax=Rhodotorula paludigena TaxID=86838 RepID=A0AAV5GP11_9BASI|nr:hypothetical protein Rhopal_007152-T1 [Rhodotorula paludigena]